ncbi:hypothetical protein E4N71_04810 [Treponema vincentii]
MKKPVCAGERSRAMQRKRNSGLPAVNTLNLLKDTFYRRQSAAVPQ